MDIKKELMWGLGMTFVVIVLTVFYILNFQKSFGSAQDKQTTTLQSTAGQNVTLTTTEVQKHNQASDCWIIVENKIYNVTSYLSLHPDGGAIIIPYCGKESTQAFLTKEGQGSHKQRAFDDLEGLYIGDLNGQKIK